MTSFMQLQYLELDSTGPTAAASFYKIDGMGDRDRLKGQGEL